MKFPRIHNTNNMIKRIHASPNSYPQHHREVEKREAAAESEIPFKYSVITKPNKLNDRITGIFASEYFMQETRLIEENPFM
jgi:hypothetical protein